jgi:Flp pilus assembly secretin CpaC
MFITIPQKALSAIQCTLLALALASPPGQVLAAMATAPDGAPAPANGLLPLHDVYGGRSPSQGFLSAVMSRSVPAGETPATLLAATGEGVYDKPSGGIGQFAPAASSMRRGSLELAANPVARAKARPAKRPTSSSSSLPPGVPRFAPLPSGPILNGLSSSFTLPAGIVATPNHLTLTKGKAIVLDLPRPIQRVAISNPEVASALVISSTQIQLLGNQVGVANLLLWENARSNEHSVVDLSVEQDVSALSRQLRQLNPNLNVNPVAAQDAVILTGEVDDPSTAQLAVTLAKLFFNGSGEGGKSSSGGGGGKGDALPSQAPGSATPGTNNQVINLIRVKGVPSTKQELVQAKLRDISPNIRLDVIGNIDGSEKAMLTGKVTLPGHIAKAVNLTSAFYGKPGLKVLNGPGGNVVSSKGDNSFQGQEAFSSNLDTNLLQGSIITDGSGNVVSMLEVENKPQIRCSIKFLSVSRSNLNQLGNSIQGFSGNTGFVSMSGAQSAASPISRFSSFGSSATGTGWSVARSTPNSVINQGSVVGQNFGDGVSQVLTLGSKLALAISAMEQKGSAKTLAEPTLTLLSGEKASFLAGGEIPIPVPQGATGAVTVQYKEYGIRLNIIATVTDQGRINLQVAPEVSTVDTQNSVSINNLTLRSFSTRRMQTTLEMTDQQALVLAGLFQQDESRSLSGLPGISGVPVLGSFFRSKWKTSQNLEMVVIVRPEIVYTDANGNVIPVSNSAPADATAPAQEVPVNTSMASPPAQAEEQPAVETAEKPATPAKPYVLRAEPQKSAANETPRASSEKAPSSSEPVEPPTPKPQADAETLTPPLAMMMLHPQPAAPQDFRWNEDSKQPAERIPMDIFGDMGNAPERRSRP